MAARAGVLAVRAAADHRRSLLSLFSGLLMLRRRPDRAESLRLIAFAIAAPFMASGVVLPNNMAPVSTAIGLLIFLVGARAVPRDPGPARAVHVAVPRRRRWPRWSAGAA